MTFQISLRYFVRFFVFIIVCLVVVAFTFSWFVCLQRFHFSFSSFSYRVSFITLLFPPFLPFHSGRSIKTRLYSVFRPRAVSWRPWRPTWPTWRGGSRDRTPPRPRGPLQEGERRESIVPGGSCSLSRIAVVIMSTQYTHVFMFSSVNNFFHSFEDFSNSFLNLFCHISIF